MLSSIQYLAWQGLAIRGDGTGEIDGNFSQLMKLRSEDDPLLLDWLKKKTVKYTGHDMQNEALQVMALRILRQIASSIQTSIFTIMVDETTDVGTKEQVVIVLRWVDNKLNVNEDFIGLYLADSITSDSLVAIIHDVLLRMNLKLENCRGQCYDGASNMKGCRRGVATQISCEEPRAIYTHCYGHSLNLACQDTVRSVKVIKDAMDITFELSKLLKYSSK